MTTTEAIKQLQTEHDLIAGEYDLDGSQFAPALLEALAMAIEALKARDMTLYMNLPEVSAEEVVEILKRNNRIELLPSGKDTNVPSKDCVDRAEAQTAIQFAARRYTVAHEAHGEGYVVWSDNLISVTDAMNALREVPSAQPEKTQLSGESTTKDSTFDCISRQAAIDALDCINGTEEVLRSLPSAQPEREKGKWTKDCACEICGFKPWYERDIHTLSFCPNCGADMR